MALATSALPSTLPGQVWRANQAMHPPGRVLASGHPALAAHLPGRGWPSHCLIELLTDHPGHGEATLLQPALAKLAGHGPVLLVQPPYAPLAQAWQQHWPAQAPLWWLQTASLANQLWALHQALRSGACAAVLGWLAHAPAPALRRLHLAAHNTTALLVLVRPLAAQHHSSPAPLRLGLQPCPNGVQVHFLKTRGLRPEHPVTLALNAPDPASPPRPPGAIRPAAAPAAHVP